MPSLPDNPFLSPDPEQPERWLIQGDWTLADYGRLRHLVSQAKAHAIHQFSLANLGRLDTAGGQMLVELLGADGLQRACTEADLSIERQILLQRIADSQQQALHSNDNVNQPGLVSEILARIGQAMVVFWHHLIDLLGFLGLTLASFTRLAVQPARWRPTAVAAQIEQTALNALPIVALLTFMVGAVVAFLGATVLADFGATVFTVDLVAFAFLREFGVLLAAILLAGRTASAFTAQIGSMKANEEIDAIRAIGLNPMDLLVLPRVLAMLIALPLLTFVAIISGIFGGAMVCALALDISPTMFLSQMQQNVEMRHFLLGMAKAPVFALLIAVIGCLEGFRVTGSAESVGEHTTSSVVQCIFAVILVDALAALFYMEMGW
ncbi:MlaE family ABC transporter permease [Halopseudomonas salegens]|uniref:Phospholipid/cholesterol/gamma-HCH transport system permease protein n=1 Tax=Halopseudomonas salegens TaxID=1434072 RepID=A0A1H2GTE9_9GAMM|nr:ABC transporter permease [Halopseudomonas salegens]SDU22772.1 phospholipid/cholesterol/gamma-HCH transport system permease protein [Halopseudomonas salegens]